MFLQEERNHCNQMQKIMELLFVEQIGIEANYSLKMIMLNRLLRVLIQQEKYCVLYFGVISDV